MYVYIYIINLLTMSFTLCRSRCVHSSSLASIDTYYCNNRYQNGLVFDGTNRVARLCAFDIATGNCTCEGYPLFNNLLRISLKNLTWNIYKDQNKPAN